MVNGEMISSGVMIGIVLFCFFVFAMVFFRLGKKQTKKEIPQPPDVKSRAGLMEQKKRAKKKALIEENKKLKKELAELNGQRHKKSKLSISVQETIPYLADYKYGVFEISKGEEKNKQKYSICFAFDDMNYSTLRAEEAKQIFLKYRDFLNMLPAEAEFTMMIDNRFIDINKFREEVSLSVKDDEYDIYRREMNEIYENLLITDKQKIRKKRYLVVTISAVDQLEAFTMLSRLEDDIAKAFKRVGTDIRRLTTMERHEQLHDIFRPQEIGKFNEHHDIKYEEFAKWRISMKDYICPDGFTFKSNHFEMGERYAQTLFVLTYPSTMSDTFLQRLTDVSFDIRVSMSIRPTFMHDGIKMVNKSILAMEADRQKQEKDNIRAGFSPDMINHNLKDALVGAYEMREDVKENNQKIFFFSIVIMHTADSLEILYSQRDTLKSLATQFLLDLRVLNNQQEKGMIQSLPLGHNILDISTPTTSDSTAIFIPFISQELYDTDGIYYGLNGTSKNPIFLDRTKLINSNGFVLGASGAGKSFSGKREIISILLKTEDDIIIIDPEGEYVPFLLLLKGEHIIISSASNTHINPLDLDEDYLGDEKAVTPDDIIFKKIEFVTSLIETAIKDQYTGNLSQEEKALIENCLLKAYIPLKEHQFDPEFTPTFKDVQRIMNQVEASEMAKKIALAFTRFSSGSLSIFSHATNVDIKNRLAVYDISSLGAQLNELASMIMLDAVWQKVLKNQRRGKRTWVYIDEFTILLRNESSKQFFLDVFKRFRKKMGSATALTQNVTSLLRDEDAIEMLANAEFVYLLNQSAMDIKALCEIWGLSETQEEYVNHAEKGSGLLKAGRFFIPFQDSFPKDTALYKAMTTDPKERKIIDNLGDDLSVS